MTPKLAEIERRAIEAQSLPSFPINVEEIRRTIEALLSQFGKGGIFDEYTVHSFDHVYEMLRSLEWLVPADTSQLLTLADWLLLTLSCYFHDLGLLVTKDEFASRDLSNFREFTERVLFAGPEGPDYRAKVHELHEEQREKFLYQEFVRYNHARRVRDWIVGKPNIALGYAQAAANQISELLSPLDRVVRVDFANICESHNLDDLNSEQEYPLYRPYGSSEEEATNVQYIALLLRTTDLIQITNQRAPTVLYRRALPEKFGRWKPSRAVREAWDRCRGLPIRRWAGARAEPRGNQIINPTKDPVSQIEWLKQNAVRHVRPQPKTDRFGDVSRDIQSDTIEVFADFNSPDGYFGLTSYLQYAGKELQKSFELAEKSKKFQLRRSYHFHGASLMMGTLRLRGLSLASLVLN